MRKLASLHLGQRYICQSY